MNATLTIPTTPIVDMDTITSAVFHQVGERRYELPEADIHIVPMSGGVDSTVTALVMRALFPGQEFLFVFTDTGVEVKGTYESLSRFEDATGCTITRVSQDRDLYQVIEDQGSFLPAPHARFCTRQMKVVPYVEFLNGLREGYASKRIASYVGIRADEPAREGVRYADSATDSHFPLQALGLDKRDVFAILQATIGVPSFYISRSRSGCHICLFQRRSEKLAAWDRDPEMTLRAARLESLPEGAAESLNQMNPCVSQQLGVGRNHLTFPVPGDILDKDGVLPWDRERSVKSKADKVTDDMFGGVGKRLFVAVEYTRFWAGDRWQRAFERFVTYSSTLGGLKTALKFHWQSRLDAREVLSCDTEDDLRDDVHVGLFEVEIDNWDETVEVDAGAAYTWASDRASLLEIRKVGRIVQNILLSAELERLRATGGADRWDRELLDIIQGREPLKEGRILWSGIFERPKGADLEDDIDIEEAPVPCVQCSR